MNKPVVLITGALTGIGRAVGRSLVHHGSRPQRRRRSQCELTLFGRPGSREGADYYDPRPINAQCISSGRRKSNG
jgi:NAD(P)-dependent dehydrogenase (short-subunit alcohol dehydrogenase family)